jgi:site-specific DNA recombinase
MKRAIVYARTSRDDRNNDDRNLAGQLAMGREYCLKNGYSILAELAEDDRGASGAAINLPQLSKVRELARAGSFDVLVVRELDRLSRSLGKQLTVEEELNHNGVVVEYVLYDYPDTLEGSLMKNVRASIAEYEKGKITERMNRGKSLTVNGGYVVISTGAPYGYRATREVNEKGKETHLKLEIERQEAAIIRQIYVWYAREFLPIREIVRRLDSMGAPVPENGGRKRKGGWPRSTIFRILRNSAYMGEWKYDYHDVDDNGELKTLVAKIPAIIEEPLWNVAQAILDKNRENKARATKYDYLFGRRLKCGKCGQYMVCEPQKRGNHLYLYYVCSGEGHTRKHGCEGMRVRIDPVDCIAWDWITSILEDPEKLQQEIDIFQDRANRDNAPTLEQLQITEELLEENRKKLSKLLDAYMSGTWTLEEVQDRKLRLEQTVKSLDDQRIELLSALEGYILTPEQIDDIQAFAADLRDRLEDATIEQKLQLFYILNVTGTLTLEDGEKTLSVFCKIRPGGDMFTVSNMASGCCDSRSMLAPPIPAFGGCPRSVPAPPVGRCGHARRAPAGSAQTIEHRLSRRAGTHAERILT